MADFQQFIKDHTNATYRGMNWITYIDGGVEMYISFQVLLKFISENLNLFSSNSPIVNIDWESDKPFYALSCHISTDLQTCYLYNDKLKIEDGSNPNPNIATFHPFTQFSDSNLTVVNSNLRSDSGATSEDYVYPQVGNINYIYLNVGYLSGIIANNLDKENKISIGKFLQIICDDLNRALGGINDFQVIINSDDVPNILTIIDVNQNRIKELTKVYKNSQTLATIQAQGIGLDNGGKATFVKTIKAESSITPEIASAISIGAQANANQIGEEATSFSRLSKGLIDRLYPEKYTAKTKNTVNEPLVKRFQSNIDSFKQLIANLQKNGDAESAQIYLKLSDEDNNGPIISDLFKAIVGEFTEKNLSNPTFIPIKLELDLLGISGIRIFEQFELSTDVLPLSYQKDFNFIITGISHEVNTHKWITKLAALTYLKEQPIDTSTKTIKAIDLKLSTLTPTSTTPSGVCLPKVLNSGTYKKTYTLGNQQLSSYAKAWNDLFKDVSIDGTIADKSSLCAQGTYNIAYNFRTQYIISHTAKPFKPSLVTKGKLKSAGGNANQDSYWASLTGGYLDYTKQLVGTGLTKNEIDKAIGSIEYNVGDILVYYSEDSSTADGKYGHTQIYVGDLSPSGFSSDIKNNYGTRFVYRNKSRYPSECYTLYLFRGPQLT